MSFVACNGEDDVSLVALFVDGDNAPRAITLNSEGEAVIRYDVKNSNDKRVSIQPRYGAVSFNEGNSANYKAPKTKEALKDSVVVTSVAYPSENITLVVTVNPSNGGSDDDVTVSLSPENITKAAGEQVDFTATLANLDEDDPAGVIWSGQGVEFRVKGESRAVVVAPEKEGIYLVKATSKANANRFAEASLTVQNDSGDIAVAVTPASATAVAGDDVSFSAEVTGLESGDTRGVTWTADGVAFKRQGDNTAVVIAPAKEGIYIIKAASKENPQRFAEAQLTVENDSGNIAVTVAPATVTATAGKEVSLTAEVTGLQNGDARGVTWSGEGITFQRQSDTTAVAIAPDKEGIYIVKASSKANPNRFAEAQLTVENDSGNIAVTVTPATITATAGKEISLTAEVTGLQNGDARGVTWSAEGITFQRQSETTAVLIAPEKEGIYIIKAASKQNPNRFAEAQLTVENDSGNIAVTVTPATVTAIAGKEISLTAEVTGLQNGDARGVTWSAEGITFKRQSDTTAVLITPDTKGIYLIRATSKQNPNRFAEAQLTVENDSGNIAVAINPATITQSSGDEVSFTAQVTGLQDGDARGVTWSAEGVTFQRQSDTTAVLIAPEKEGIYIIKAASKQNTQRFAEAQLTVANNIAVALTPDTVTINEGAEQVFTVDVTGTDDKRLTWAVTGGSLKIDGLSAVYTAPKEDGNYFLTVTSQADPRRNDQSTIVVQDAGQNNVEVVVNPSNPTIGTREKVDFTAKVTGAENKDVSWKVTDGSLVIDGNKASYTAPDNAGTYSITATSKADPDVETSVNITVNAVAVTLDPTTVTLQPEKTVALTATVAGAQDTGVTWRASAGSLSISGNTVVYTAPKEEGTYVVEAMSKADNRRSARTIVTVDDEVKVTLNPETLELGTGETARISAIVTGDSNTDVTWSASAGTITGTGRTVDYRAPNAAGSYTITATSQADANKSATAVVTVSEVAVTITPSSVTLEAGKSQSFRANVTGASNKTVKWSANEGTLSDVTDNQVTYTAPNQAGNYLLTATSNANRTTEKSVTVTVK